MREIGEPPHLAPAANHRIENEPGEPVEEGEDHQPGRQDRGRQPRHQVGVHVGDAERDREDHRQRRQQRADPAEEQHRPLDAVERDDRAQDAPAVRIGAELGGRAFGAGEIGRLDLGDGHLEFERMDADLGLDLESGRQHRKTFDEAAREDTVARQDVRKAAAEQTGEHPRQQPVAEAMTAAIGLDRLPHPAADHHVELLVEKALDQRRNGGRVVGRVAIGHDIDVGIDVGEHAADDIALALHPFGANNRAGGCGDLTGAIAAVVVVDVDSGVGQRGSETGDRLRDRRFLVVAGQQDCDSRRVGIRHCPIPVIPAKAGTHLPCSIPAPR